MVSILIFKAKRSSDELIAPCAEKGSLKIEAGVYYKIMHFDHEASKLFS
jgi:hypothetical protein